MAITIQVTAETFERARTLAQRDGRAIDAVVSELADEAIANEVERVARTTLHPEWEAEIDRRLASIADGSETFKPAAQAIVDIRTHFGW